MAMGVADGECWGRMLFEVEKVMLVMWVVVGISVKFNQKKLLAKDIHLGISTSQ